MKLINKNSGSKFFKLLTVLFFVQTILLGQSTFYISSSQGNDSNDGKSPNSPWRTINKVNTETNSFIPGDKILFKSGDSFIDNNLVIYSSGNSDKKITYSSYGEGGKPIIGSKSLAVSPVVLVYGQFVIIENLIVQAGNAKPKAGGILVDAGHYIIRNNDVLGGESSHEAVSGISITKGSNNVIVTKNSIKGFGNGIIGYECLNTIISDNIVHDIWRTNGSYESGGWGIRLIGNNFPHGFDFKYSSKISNNEIFDFERYAIDCALSSNVIIEYNKIHNALPPNYGGTDGFGSGIKAGEKNAVTKDGTIGTIVRYNTIYNLKGSPDNAWQSNNGIETVNSEDGWIYGNLIYDIDGSGITRTGLDNFPFRNDLSWRIFNNTIVSNNFCIYIEARTTSPTYISNNIIYPLNSAFSAIMAKQDVYEGNNLYVNRSGISSNENSSNTLAIYQRYGTTFNVGETSIFNTEPGFENYNSKNFNLTVNSKCIDNGAILGSSPDGVLIRGKDLKGVSVVGKPDIGAFEFVGSQPSNDDPFLRVFLEGPFSGSKMLTILLQNNWLPNTQPYFEPPWNLIDNIDKTYSGNDIVDWIIVELRSNENTILKSKAALLKEDGTVLNPNGKKLSFDNIETGKYFIVIRHRNHLDVMSANKVDVVPSQPISYNFTDSQSKAFGNNAMIQLPNGNFAMYSGDGDLNNVINNLDFGTVANSIPKQGYHNSDLDMNGVVNVLDYNKINKNILKGSQVPN